MPLQKCHEATEPEDILQKCHEATEPEDIHSSKSNR